MTSPNCNRLSSAGEDLLIERYRDGMIDPSDFDGDVRRFTVVSDIDLCFSFVDRFKHPRFIDANNAGVADFELNAAGQISSMTAFISVADKQLPRGFGSIQNDGFGTDVKFRVTRGFQKKANEHRQRHQK